MSQNPPIISPEEIARGLNTVRADQIAQMDAGEHDARYFGATSSDSTRILKAINRQGELVRRFYRAGRNRYQLTPLGLAVRNHICTIQGGTAVEAAEKAIRDHAAAHGPAGSAWNISMVLDAVLPAVRNAISKASSS